MVFDGLRCFQKPKIAGKCPVLSQRVAGPLGTHVHHFRCAVSQPVAQACVLIRLTVGLCE